MSRQPIVFVLILCNVVLFGNCIAREKDGMMVFDLGQIEVVGKSEKIEVPSITEISSLETTKKLSTNVADAVKNSPGLITSSGSKDEPHIMLRGLDQERILILYDGIPMAAPYFGDVDMSQIPLDQVESIKIIRGNASVFYGANALGGVISLVSAEPKEGFHGRIFASMDKESNTVMRLNHGARHDSFFYQLSVGLRESDGFPMSKDFEEINLPDGGFIEDGDIRENSDLSQQSAGFKVGFESTDKAFIFSAHVIDSEKGIPQSTDPAANTRFWRFPEWRKYSLILAGRYQLNPIIDLRINTFFHKFDNRLENYTNPEYSELKWTSTYDDYSAGIVSRMAWNVSDDYVIRGSIHAILDDHQSQSNIGLSWERYQAQTYTFAVENEWYPRNKWTFQLGTSWDVYDFDSVKNLDISESTISNRTRDIRDGSFTLLSIYTPISGHELSLAASRKLRFPTMHQLFTNIELFEPKDIQTVDAETAMEYSLGYSWTTGRSLGGGISAFHYDIDKMIQRSNRDALYDNIDQARISGVEFWSGYRPEIGFYSRMNLTFLDAENRSPDRISDDLTYVPKWTLNAHVGYLFRWGTDIRFSTEYRSDVTEFTGASEAVTISSYTVWDLTVRHEFNFGLGITVQGTNLTDKNYYQETGFERPGRNFKIAVNYSL